MFGSPPFVHRFQPSFLQCPVLVRWRFPSAYRFLRLFQTAFLLGTKFLLYTELRNSSFICWNISLISSLRNPSSLVITYDNLLLISLSCCLRFVCKVIPAADCAPYPSDVSSFGLMEESVNAAVQIYLRNMSGFGKCTHENWLLATWI